MIRRASASRTGCVRVQWRRTRRASCLTPCGAHTSAGTTCASGRARQRSDCKPLSASGCRPPAITGRVGQATWEDTSDSRRLQNSAERRSHKQTCSNVSHWRESCTHHRSFGQRHDAWQAGECSGDTRQYIEPDRDTEAGFITVSKTATSLLSSKSTPPRRRNQYAEDF